MFSIHSCCRAYRYRIHAISSSVDSTNKREDKETITYNKHELRRIIERAVLEISPVMERFLF
jgi:hypothetical protein